MATETKVTSSPTKQVELTIQVVVPVPVASLLGGNGGTKGLAKIDAERRYFANALLRRGAKLISQKEVA